MGSDPAGAQSLEPLSTHRIPVSDLSTPPPLSAPTDPLASAGVEPEAAAALTDDPEMATTLSTGDVVEYYALDAVGSVRVVFSETGSVIARADYMPFGTEHAASGNLPAQRFTGQERDHEAGLDYFGARYYQSRHGRFSTVDPLFGNALLDPQQWNRYAYVRNNPLSFVDPDRQLLAALVASWWWTSGTRSDDGGGDENGGGGGGSCRTTVCVDVTAPMPQDEPTSDGWFDWVPSMVEGIHWGTTAAAPGWEPYEPQASGGWGTTVAVAAASLRQPAKTAKDLAKGGNRILKTLGKAGQAKGGFQAFGSFAAFKRVMGPAGTNQHWHHTVERTPINVARFGPQAIHNTQNVIPLDVGVHRQISGFYSSIQPQVTGSTTRTVRQWLAAQPYDVQRSFGEQILKTVGGL